MSAVVLATTFTKRETLKLTTRDDATPLKDVAAGTVIKYEGHVVQEIVNEETGERFNSVLVKSGDTIYATRSASFMKRLGEIVELLADDDSGEDIMLRIVKGRAKSGNQFTSCALA